MSANSALGLDSLGQLRILAASCQLPFRGTAIDAPFVERFVRSRQCTEILNIPSESTVSDAHNQPTCPQAASPAANV